MDTKKFFITTIALSLAAHIVVLALVGFLAHTGDTDTEEVYTVTFEKQPDRTAAAQEEEQEPKALLENIRSRARGGSVDTVDLDNTETKYYPYLLQVKERIDRQWSYPEDSFTRGRGGNHRRRIFNSAGGKPRGVPRRRFIGPPFPRRGIAARHPVGRSLCPSFRRIRTGAAQYRGKIPLHPRGLKEHAPL